MHSRIRRGPRLGGFFIALAVAKKDFVWYTYRVPLRVLYVDLNSFFAACEQQLHPELRGRPVAVVPVIADTTFVIAASVQAKKFGVKTGVRVSDAKRMCPGLVMVAGNHETYLDFHHKIIDAVHSCIPVDKVWSVDEMACRLMGKEREPDRARAIAMNIKKALLARVGECLTCSIGIAPNRVLAKTASDMQKPDGLVTIEEHELPHKLYSLKLSDFAGIGPKMESRLRTAGINTVEELCSKSKDELIQVWGGIIGGEWWQWLRGHDMPERRTKARTLGHQHVLPPKMRNREGARAVLMRLLHKAAARARKCGYLGGALRTTVRHTAGEGFEDVVTLSPPVNDTLSLVRVLASQWEKYSRQTWPGELRKVSVTLLELEPVESATPSLFSGPANEDRLAKAMDRLNAKYGRNTVYAASMQPAKGSAPVRIAFGNIPRHIDVAG